MSKPLVSIILPCYKMGKFISEALESVSQQTYPNWEVIAVDDCGPEDGTREVIEAFASSRSTYSVKLLKLENNQGVGAARNAGAAVARGDFLAFLDPDDVWLPNHLSVHLENHDYQGQRLATVSRMSVCDQQRQDEMHEEWGYSPWEKSIFPITLALRNVIIPSMVVMPAEIFREVGGYDEDRGRQHTEDWDLWIRLVDHGVKFQFLDVLTGHYRRHDNGATANRTLMRKRVIAFSAKHHERLVPDVGLAVVALAERIDGLEARLNWLQRNPIIRILSALQKLFGMHKRAK